MRFPWSSKSRRVRHKPIVQTPFVGRESMCAVLDRHLQAAREGTSQYVGLVGPSGMGKSALLTEFVLMHRVSPEVLMVQLHAGDCLIESEFYIHVFDALRAQSENVLKRLFNDTKRLRKTLSVNWDETEFCHILTSVDWAQFQESSSHEAQRSGMRSDPLRQLFTVVREHPWAVGAATILDIVTREMPRQELLTPGVQRWAALLETVQSRRLPENTALVLVIDQLLDGLTSHPDAMQRWTHHWRKFVEISREYGLPLLIVWGGTSDSLQPVQQGVSDVVDLTLHPLEALQEKDCQELIQRLQRALPRPAQRPWQQWVTAPAERFRQPGFLLLATTWLASVAETQKGADAIVLPGEQANETALINDLVEAIAQRHAEARAFFQQLMGAWAFLPPGKAFKVEEILPLCDLDALGLDPVAGRTTLETLLGECVRYGLLRYDTYDDRYITNHGRVQEVLQQLVCPEAHARRVMSGQRQLAAAITRQVQRGDREALRELAPLIELEGGAEAGSLASYIATPLRRILTWSSKEERQLIAHALGKLRSPLAADLLMIMLNDQEAEVRSRAAQSLADLEGLATCPALLKACRDLNSDVRWIAASALGKIDERTTVDALIDMLTDEDKEVGRIAAEGLGMKGDARAVPHLIDAVHDNYPLLRESAAMALGQLADRRALPALQELLQDTNRQVRRSAQEALTQFSASPC